MGRITPSFRIGFQKLVKKLKKEYCAALMDVSRRNAFYSLVKAWSSELGAMSYASIPSVLDVMLLTAVIDNRKHILRLSERFDAIESKLKELESISEMV